MGMGGGGSKFTPPKPPPPPEPDDEERLAELARQRRALSQQRAGRLSLRIDPNPALAAQVTSSGLRITP